MNPRINEQTLASSVKHAIDELGISASCIEAPELLGNLLAACAYRYVRQQTVANGEPFTDPQIIQSLSYLSFFIHIDADGEVIPSVVYSVPAEDHEEDNPFNGRFAFPKRRQRKGSKKLFMQTRRAMRRIDSPPIYYAVDDNKQEVPNEEIPPLVLKHPDGLTTIYINNVTINLTADTIQQLIVCPQQVINQFAEQIKEAAFQAAKPAEEGRDKES